MKRRNELNMKPAAVIHMLSPRNFKIGSYTRSPHVGGLATVSRHPAVVHAGGGVSYMVTPYIYIYVYTNIYIYIHIYIYTYIYTYICMYVCMSLYLCSSVSLYLYLVYKSHDG